MADSQGRKPGDPGYDASDDSQNTDNGNGTFTDNQGNVMDSGGGLISAAPQSGGVTYENPVAGGGFSADAPAPDQGPSAYNAPNAPSAPAAPGAPSAPAAPSGPSYSSPTSSPGVATVPQQSPYGISAADLAKIQAGFAASSGLSIKQLDEQMREFDANLDWQKQMWQQQGLPQLAIAQRAQDLEQQKFQQMSDMATRQQDWVQTIGARQAALAEKAQADANAIAQGQLGVQQGQLGVAQGQLGLDTLKTAASLTGPADWIKAVNYSRGVSQTNLPAFLQQLMTGGNTAVMGGPAPGATPSAPNTLPGLAADLTAGTTGQNPATQAASPIFHALAGTLGAATSPTVGAGGQPVDAAANQVRNVFNAGGQALGPQALEGLSTNEMQMLQGGGADLGEDVQGFMDAYKRSRVGQSAAQPGSMAA